MYMNDKEIIGKIHSAMYYQLKKTGVFAPVDVLMDIGLLSKANYEAWRFGRIPYLEAVCTVNLRKLSSIMHEVWVYASKNGLKPSVSVYKRWGMKKKNGQGKPPVILLRFSKSNDPGIEKQYATCYVDMRRVEEIKADKQETQKDTDVEPPHETNYEENTGK